jgi:hypothetical protein
MNLQEQLSRMKSMMGIIEEDDNQRVHFDMQDLLDRGIIFITQAHDLSTGEMIPPQEDPQTGEIFNDSTNLITLWNITHPEEGTQDFISKALEHPRPDQISYWQNAQNQLSQEKYDQILRSIELQNKNSAELTEGELTERCWKGYTQKGMKTMFGKKYPNCVKKTKK